MSNIPSYLCLAAVSQRIDRLPDRDETRDSLDQALVVWLAKANCAVVPVPNALAEQTTGVRIEAWLNALAPDMVLLSGGNDIGEFAGRDATEEAMLDWAELKGRPVLGICRGMQMLGVRAGAMPLQLEGHIRTHHDLGGCWPGRVNSFHHFGFIECPPGYHVLSRAADGSIEAMRHDALPWEGWMWHPERGTSCAQDIQRLLWILNND